MSDARPLPDSDAATDQRLAAWMGRLALVILLGAAVLGVLTLLTA